MLYYRRFTQVPDFQNEPVYGVLVERKDTALSSAPIYSRWPEFNRQNWNHGFETRSPTETRNLRELIHYHRGSWLPFYLPSWTRDFNCLGDAVALGDMTVLVDTDFETYLEADLPDTFGRTIFFYTPANQLHFARVLSQEPGPEEGQFELTLDRPFPWGANLAEAIAGFVHLARLATEDFRWRHLTPDRARVEMGFLEVRNSNDFSGTYAMAGTALEGSNAFDEVAEAPGDPVVSDLRRGTCLGPDVYATPQAVNLSLPWAYALAAGSVTLTPETGSPTVSTLYNGDDVPVHLSAAFDVLGREALAWNTGTNSFRIRWYDSGVPQALDVEGITPILFQNWTINGDISGGEGDVVCYYLRPNDSKVYARLQREDFAVQNVVIKSPIQALGLISNEIRGQIHVLHAISARHNALEFRSSEYLIPLPAITDEMGATEALEGSFVLMVIDAVEGGEPVEVSELESSETLTGEYVDLVIDLEISGDESGGSEALEGTYVSMVIDPDTLTDEISSDEILSGTYTLIARDASGSDEATSTATITGTYA